MKISYKWLEGKMKDKLLLIVSLMFLLLPFNSVYADGCDHGYMKLAIITGMIMIAVMSVVYIYIYFKDRELFIKVIAFCFIFALFVTLIIFNIIYIIAPLLILYLFARKQGLFVKILLFCIIFIFSFFLCIYLFPLGVNPIYAVVILGILTIIIYIKLPKKEKIELKKIMPLFIILFIMTILFYNGNKISNIYTSVTCEYSGGELGGYCDTLYCKMP